MEADWIPWCVDVRWTMGSAVFGLQTRRQAGHTSTFLVHERGRQLDDTELFSLLEKSRLRWRTAESLPRLYRPL